MANKKPNEALAAGLAATSATAWTAPATSEQARPAPQKPVERLKAALTRADTANVSAHLPKRYQRDLKRLAADRGEKTQDLIAEALDDLFKKHKFAVSE
ncbi:hypothetical protein GHK68_24395 [Sinorhizobium meliloti]|uniref:ribbon-helix-helix domain-containing protein n=1 Tax=Rhizobium meliloti TaxID=382 RepID=UPI001294DE88|nr:ribbon-helix-helix domain-containing protein [Sinorhizobium meliloti]MQW45314.1 hypothetical protein [Sinorhizobium meliloti]